MDTGFKVFPMGIILSLSLISSVGHIQLFMPAKKKKKKKKEDLVEGKRIISLTDYCRNVETEISFVSYQTMREPCPLK